MGSESAFAGSDSAASAGGEAAAAPATATAAAAATRPTPPVRRTAEGGLRSSGRGARGGLEGPSVATSRRDAIGRGGMREVGVNPNPASR